MASKIGAAVFGILALALLGTAATSPALALSSPRFPSVFWLEQGRPLGASAASAEPEEIAPEAAEAGDPAGLAAATEAGEAAEPAQPGEPLEGEPLQVNPAAVVEPELPDDPDAEARPLAPHKPVIAAAKPALAEPEALVPEARPALVVPETHPAVAVPAVAKPIAPPAPEPAVLKTPAVAKPVARPKPHVTTTPPSSDEQVVRLPEDHGDFQPAPTHPVAAPAKPARPAAPARIEEPEEEEEGIGTLAISSAPAGAAVFLDNAIVGQTPIEIDVPSGRHKLRVVHPASSLEKQQQIQVKSGAVVRLKIDF